MFDPIYASATEIARAIREGEITSLAVLEAHLERIARLDGAIHAIVTLDEAGARQRALAADEALARGEIWGPLHGVPITIYDLYETIGVRTTVMCNPAFADYIPTKESSVVARLRNAGAVIMGKTNDDHDFLGDSRLFPHPANPWDTKRVLTGIGGPVAAVAAGFSPLDIGGDAGSTQVPAHYAGVFALRPTQHRLPMANVFIGGSIDSVLNIGTMAPVARNVEDLRLALEIIAGPDGFDMEVPPIPLGEYVAAPLDTLRIAWAPRIPGAVMDDEIGGAIAALAAKLQGEGATMEQRLPAIDFEWMMAVREKAFAMPIEAVNEINTGEPGPSLGAFLKGRDEQNEVRRIWDRFMDDWDALLVPVGAITAPLRGQPDRVVNGEVLTMEQRMFASMYSQIAPVTGLPTVIMPLGRSQAGMPFGVQLLGRRWQEMRLLAVAEQVAKVTGGFMRPPGY